jgi:predicted outer membrane repeat protein
MSGDVTVEGIVFTENNAENGGAISTGGGLDSTNCVYDRNHGDSGGAIHMKNGAAVITQCSFSGNIAALNGGAIFLSVQNVTNNITDSYFKGNSAQNSGGALYSSGFNTTNPTDTTIARSYFEGNFVNYENGGAINLAGTRLNVSQCTFSGNYTRTNSGGNGGALAINALSYGIVNSTFYSNTAYGQGGGIFLGEDAGSGITPSVVMYCTFTKNGADIGGGIAAGADSTLTMELCAVVGNSASVGKDTFRHSAASIKSGGYSVIGNHGAGEPGHYSQNVEWTADTGISVRKLDDKYNVQAAMVFGNNPGLETNDGGVVTPYMTGSTLSGGTLRSYVTTVALVLNTSPGPSRNLAIAILRGGVAEGDFYDSFREYAHTDARGVRRNASLPAPAGGSFCDAGAYQTIDSSGGTTPPSDTIASVKISGLPNFMTSVGQTCTLTAVVFSMDGNRMPNEAVTWSSTDKNVALIDQFGNLVLLSRGECKIIATTQRASYNLPAAIDEVYVVVKDGRGYANIDPIVLERVVTFNNNTLGKSGTQAYLATDADPADVKASPFVSEFMTKYGAKPEQIANIAQANNLVFRSSPQSSYRATMTALDTSAELSTRQSENRAAMTALKPSIGLSMFTLTDEGALLAMKYVYNLDWDYVGEMLGRSVTEPTKNDVAELFKSLSLVFTNEGRENAVVIDRDGSSGIAVTEALSSGALKFESAGSLVLRLDVLIGDASATGGRSVNLIGNKIVVADNKANGQIAGEMWLLGDESASGGGSSGGSSGSGSGGEGGGGGGCSAGFGIPAILSALALCFAMKRRR